jgi:flagellar protein FlaF
MKSQINAYRNAASMRTDFRSQEAQLFKRVTYALEQGKAKANGLDLVRAASDNKLLWMTVVQLVSDETNQLPMALRQQLASIGRAVIKEIDDNITGNLDVDFLIQINTQIIEGLTASALQPAAAAP